jgi:hypothetical protein
MIGSEPLGVVVDAVPGTVASLGARLALGRHLMRMLAIRNRSDRGRQVDQHPVIEIHPRQRRRDFTPFLIHVVRNRGHVVVMADDGKGLRLRGKVRPGQLRIAVVGQRDAGSRVHLGECKPDGDHAPIRK